MKKTQLGLILGLTSTLATLTAITPAHALTWTVNATSTNPAATINGSFTIDNESLGSGATVTASSISFGVNPNFVTYNNNASITVGGTVSLASGTSFDQSATDGLVSIGGGGGTTFAGGATASGGVTGTVPFNFSATPGLVVLGLIVGGGKAKKHLPKIRKKITSFLGKK